MTAMGSVGNPGATGPVVSVIIPVYNQQQYVRECIESVLAQTLEDIEVICVDDGSTDATPEILAQMAAADPRLVVLARPHSNAGQARNAGLKIARGEYLSFLDSDDLFAPAMLETLVAKAEEADADVVVARWSVLDSATGKKSDADWFWAGKKFGEPVMAPGLRQSLFTDFVGWSWDKLVRAELVASKGLEFQSIASTNDACFVYMALILANRIVVLPDHFVTHRTSVAGSIEATRAWSNFFAAAEEIATQLRARGLWSDYADSHATWLAERCLWDARTLPSAQRREVIAYANDVVRPQLHTKLRPATRIFFVLIHRAWTRRILEFVIGLGWIENVAVKLKRSLLARSIQ